MQSKNSKEILVTMLFFATIFLGLLIYLSYFTATNEQKMINNSYNSRQKLLAEENTRGTILSANGDILATTQIDSAGKETRVYPFANLFSHVVGFSTKGKTGIESLSNYYLINSNIPLDEKVKNDISNVKNPGNNIVTTLDQDLQQVAYDSLGVYKGAIIVMEAKTGKILAMVSKPDFDPNNIVSIWDELVSDHESSVLLNRATQGIYPPGSTFKIATALEYIRENPETYNDYSFQCNGSYTNGDSTINCYHGTVHGTLNFMTSFAKSCNSSFANIGLTLDKNQFSTTLNQLLFNQKLPIDLNYTKSNLQIDDTTSDEEMIQIAIGQGKAEITPIQLAMITSAVANQGTCMTPYVVDHIETGDGELLKAYKPNSYKELMTKQEASILTSMMEDVVEEGTGKKMADSPYQAAGKTGSAEYNGVKEDSHAWFTGFAPANDPEIVVTIIVEGIGSGGDYAVPIAKRIFDDYFEVK